MSDFLIENPAIEESLTDHTRMRGIRESSHVFFFLGKYEECPEIYSHLRWKQELVTRSIPKRRQQKTNKRMIKDHS